MSYTHEWVSKGEQIRGIFEKYPFLKQFLHCGYMFTKKINEFLGEEIYSYQTPLTSETMNDILDRIYKKFPEYFL